MERLPQIEMEWEGRGEDMEESASHRNGRRGNGRGWKDLPHIEMEEERMEDPATDGNGMGGKGRGEDGGICLKYKWKGREWERMA